jgi:BirA family biotin operon repressor/biotin-[acetyl-CoA-carboxylase] ligase
MSSEIARSPFNLGRFGELAPIWRDKTFYFPVIGSTNLEAREQLRREVGHPRECLLVTDSQTAGRGRLGRNWQAPAGSGLLFTLAFPLAPLSLEQAFLYTASLGLAVKTAVEQLEPEAMVSLKWPNDILRQGSKAGGILAELENNLGSGRNESWLVLGCGLNISLSNADLEAAGIADKATNLAPQPLPREALLAEILARFDRYRLSLNQHPEQVWQEWSSTLVTIGQEVQVLNGANPEILIGRAVSVTRDGALRVEDAQGKQHQVQAGDVSVRLSDGRYSA